MNNVTAIIISFLRPGYTKACINSLREQYPDIKIIVGENSNHNEELAELCREKNASYIQLPFDSGVCFARNRLVELVETDYVMVGDDDFFYDHNAMTEKMALFLDNNKEFDLIGGRVSVRGAIGNYQGFIEKNEKNFVSTAIDLENTEYQNDEASGLRYCKADLTFNYFVARVEKVRQVPWDTKIKVAYEHFSWFYDFKCFGGKVAFSPDPIVIHKPAWVDPQEDTRYASFRNRKDDKQRFFDKYEIDYIVSMNGSKTFNPNYHQVSTTGKTSHIKYIDFCITTFMRPNALERLLLSIARFYPAANIYVADQNEKFDRVFYRKLAAKLFNADLQKRMSVKHLEHDCGLSFARNYLVTTTPNQYKLILDDDMEFSEETDIEKMFELLEAHPNAGIVGGKVNQLGSDLHFEFDLAIKDKTLYQVPDNQRYKNLKGITYKLTGCVLNFALMRKDLFNYVKWDPQLKVNEHLDFYLKMQKLPHKIIYTPDVVMSHPPAIRENNYKEFRQRKEFLVLMMKKYQINKIKYLNGQCFELMPDGVSIKRYKELPENFDQIKK